MIKVRNLTKIFGNLKVLDNVDLDVSNGETLAIIGPSGCGKSTFLRVVIGLEGPSRGSVVVDGQDTTRLKEEGWIRLRKKFGMVFQSSALFDSLSVAENVGFALREHTRLKEREINKIVKEKLAMVDLEGTENLMPAELSGGMQKRVSLARAIALNPSLILYDEPTTGLDPITSDAIEKLINKLARELKVTSILVTHQLSTIFRTANRIIMVDKGRFIEAGSVEDTKKSSNPIIRNFIDCGMI